MPKPAFCGGNTFLNHATNDEDMVQDYSGGAAVHEFTAAHDDGLPFWLYSVQFAIHTSSSWKGGGVFGGGTVALTNGITLECRDTDDSVLLDLTAGLSIKRNRDIVQFTGYSRVNTQATSHALMGKRIEMVAMFGGPLLLEDGQKITAVLNDDFTAAALNMQMMWMKARGVYSDSFRGSQFRD